MRGSPAGAPFLNASQTTASMAGSARRFSTALPKHPGHVVRAPLLQRSHQRLAGYPASKRTGGLPAQMPLRPLQHLEDELQPAVRRVHLPLVQPQVQDVARLPRRRHDLGSRAKGQPRGEVVKKGVPTVPKSR